MRNRAVAIFGTPGRAGGLARFVLGPAMVACGLAGGLVAPSACTALLGTDPVQCRDNASCARFPNAVCDVTNGVCVPRPVLLDASPEALGPSDAVPGDTSDLSARDAETSTGGDTRPDAGSPDTNIDQHAHVTCPDLDHNDVVDCQESLVANPDFATGATGWSPEPGVTQAAPGNAATGDAAGAIAIVNTNWANLEGSTMAGSKQCLTVRGDAWYSLHAEVLIPVDQETTTSAGVAMQSFATPDCSGPANSVLYQLLVGASTGPNVWREVQAKCPTPTDALSLAIRLVVVKPFLQDDARALFDNVLVKAQ